MKRIDKSKTYDICNEAWKMAQMNNQYRFTVFSPIYEGEEVDYDAIGMNTFSTSWEKDLVSFDTQGWDTIEDGIDFNECPTEELRDSLGIDFEYFDDLNDGTHELNDKQKEIMAEWIEEQVEAELDSAWENYSSTFYELIDEKIKFGRKMKCRVKASVNVQYSVSNPIGKNFYSKWKYIIKT